MTSDPFVKISVRAAMHWLLSLNVGVE